MEPVPTTQSPGRAVRLMLGLQMASVQTRQKGLGAAPSSTGMQSVYRRGRRPRVPLGGLDVRIW